MNPPTLARGVVSRLGARARLVINHVLRHPEAVLQAFAIVRVGGIEVFIRREVLPHAPDAWYVPESVKTGYEISFTRYFYKPEPLRTLEEIRADILALEKETTGLLDEVLGGGAPWPSADQG